MASHRHVHHRDRSVIGHTEIVFIPKEVLREVPIACRCSSAEHLPAGLRFECRRLVAGILGILMASGVRGTILDLCTTVS